MNKLRRAGSIIAGVAIAGAEGIVNNCVVVCASFAELDDAITRHGVDAFDLCAFPLFIGDTAGWCIYDRDNFNRDMVLVIEGADHRGGAEMLALAGLQKVAISTKFPIRYDR